MTHLFETWGCALLSRLFSVTLGAHKNTSLLLFLSLSSSRHEVPLVVYFCIILLFHVHATTQPLPLPPGLLFPGPLHSRASVAILHSSGCCYLFKCEQRMVYLISILIYVFLCSFFHHPNLHSFLKVLFNDVFPICTNLS